MTNAENYTLSLAGDTFNALKTDFDMLLAKTLHNMTDKDGDAAEIKVTLKIEFRKQREPIENAGGVITGWKETIMPTFAHKITSVLQIKDQLEGLLGGKYELVWDAGLQEYVLREVDGNKGTLFDTAYEVVPDDTEMLGLPAPDEQGGGRTMKPSIDLTAVPTCDLVFELRKREGVDEIVVEPYEPYYIRTAQKKVRDEGHAIILVVID